MFLPIFTRAHIARVGNKVVSMSVHFAIPAQAAWVLLIAVGIVRAPAIRAANDPSVLTITKKAPTMAFSWLKVNIPALSH